MFIIKKRIWESREADATPQSVFLNRRQFIAGASISVMTASAYQQPAEAQFLGLFGETDVSSVTDYPLFTPKPATNPTYSDPGRAVTSESLSAVYNNFYEFGAHKSISEQAQKLNTNGWKITIDGLVEQPFEISSDELIAAAPVEERIVRHRCVETWAMTVPWIGFPLSHLLSLAKPLSSAKYVRFETFHDPAQASGQKAHWYNWPYVEGITIEEAANELAFLVVGAYGKILHKQFGAPIRLHLPWKYGFKSIKSISRVSFVEKRPISFWEHSQSNEYGFWANVNPKVSHPRWSQASEKQLGSEERIPTQIFNGYAAQVAHLYSDEMQKTFGDRLWR